MIGHTRGRIRIGALGAAGLLLSCAGAAWAGPGDSPAAGAADSAGVAEARGERKLRFHVNVGVYAGSENANAQQYEMSHFRFLNEFGLKWMRPLDAVPRLESVALAYTFIAGDALDETRHSVGPTVALRLNENWTGNISAGPMWCRGTDDFEVGAQCRAYFLYKGIVSCEGLFLTAPPHAHYEAWGGRTQTSFYGGIGLHGKPAGIVILAEAAVGAILVAYVAWLLSSADWNI